MFRPIVRAGSRIGVLVVDAEDGTVHVYPKSPGLRLAFLVAFGTVDAVFRDAQVVRDTAEWAARYPGSVFDPFADVAAALD